MKVLSDKIIKTDHTMISLVPYNLVLNEINTTPGHYLGKVELYNWPLHTQKMNHSTIDIWFNVFDFSKKLLEIMKPREIITVLIFGKFCINDTVVLTQTLHLFRDADTIYRITGFIWTFNPDAVYILKTLIGDDTLSVETIANLIKL